MGPGVVVCPAPDVGGEPGEEADGEEFLEPLLQRGHIRCGDPVCAMARFSDDPVDLRGGVGAAEVDRVVC